MLEGSACEELRINCAESVQQPSESVELSIFDTIVSRQNTLAVVIVTAQPPYRTQSASEYFIRWTGQTRDTIVSKPLCELIPISETYITDLLTNSFHSSGVQTGAPIEYLWNDGAQRITTMLVIPMFSAYLNVMDHFVIGFYENKIVQLEETERNQPTLEKVMDSINFIPVPLWVYDANGTLKAVNSATLTMFQFETFEKLTEVIGKTLTEHIESLQPRITSPAQIAQIEENNISTRAFEKIVTSGAGTDWLSDQRRELSQPASQSDLVIYRALRGKQTIEQFLSFVLPNNATEIIVKANANVIYNPWNEIIGAIFITIDITEDILKQGQRDAILAITGHDLRNPLTPIKMRLQRLQKQLQDSGANDEMLQEINIIEMQLRRIEEVANDLDAIAGSSDGESTMATCSLTGICANVAETQMKRTPDIKVVVHTNRDSIMGSWAKRHLERIIAMLVASAARRSNGKNVTIRLRAQKHRVRIDIIDKGTPFTNEQLEQLAIILSRGGAALAAGNGIDLDYSLIQTLLGMYKARLTVAPNGKSGAVFTFALPWSDEAEFDGF